MGKYYKMTFIATKVENSDGCCSRPARYAAKISLMEMLTDAPTTASAKKRGMGNIAKPTLPSARNTKNCIVYRKNFHGFSIWRITKYNSSRALDATPSKDIIEKAESDVDDDVSSVSERKKSKTTASNSASAKKQVSKALFPRQ